MDLYKPVKATNPCLSSAAKNEGVSIINKLQVNDLRILPKLGIFVRIELHVIAGVDVSPCVSHPDICIRMYNHSNSLTFYHDYA